MSYVPGFRYDLFFSYASNDNAGEWIDKFQAQLTGELTRLLGRPFSEKTVYFDKLRLRVGQAYPQELDCAAQDSAMLVPVLSPSYLSSDWCSRERSEFLKRLPPGAPFAECLAAVQVRPSGALPSTLAGAQHIDFVIPGFEEPWPTGSAKWTEAVNKLAAGLKQALQQLRSRAGSVFTGVTLNSHMDLRGSLVDYLSEQHFRAAPDPPALLEDAALCQKALAESACAVHFIGGASDAALERIESSVNYCPGPTILFRPYGAKLSPFEEELLEGLPPDKFPHRIEENEVELKQFLKDLLTRKRAAAAGSSASLSLVCDPADFPWAEAFKAAGLSTSYPKFLLEKLTNTERIGKWRQLVKDSHGLLFYQGSSPEPLLDRIWRMADSEQSKAVRKWYLADPGIDEKRKKRPADPQYDEGLQDFLAEVRRRAESGQ